MLVKNLGLRHRKIRIIPNIGADKDREKKISTGLSKNRRNKYERIQQMRLDIKKNKLRLTHSYETLRLHSENDIM